MTAYGTAAHGTTARGSTARCRERTPWTREGGRVPVRGGDVDGVGPDGRAFGYGAVRRARAAIAALAALVVLGGCATARSVDDPEDIGDDGKRNTVLLSYDVTLDAFDRLAGEEKTFLQLRCDGDGALGGYPTCFGIEVPFVGLREREEGLVWNEFAATGVEALQMKHGDYLLSKANFDVLIGRDPRTDCSEDKKGKTRCRTTYVDREEKVYRDLPVPTPFTVAPGRGCYFGHVELVVRGGEIVRYEIDPTLDERVLEGLPGALRERVRAHVTGSCLR